MGCCQTCTGSCKCIDLIACKSQTYRFHPSNRLRSGYLIASPDRKTAREFFYKIQNYVKTLTAYYHDPFDTNIRFTVTEMQYVDLTLDHGTGTVRFTFPVLDQYIGMCRILDSRGSVTWIRQPFYRTDLFYPAIYYPGPDPTTTATDSMKVYICWTVLY
jgi:hypothetical protein